MIVPFTLYTDTRQRSQPEEAVIALQLAACLLEDRQRKLGLAMLKHGLQLLQPTTIAEDLRAAYASVHYGLLPRTSPLHGMLAGGYRNTRPIPWSTR